MLPRTLLSLTALAASAALAQVGAPGTAACRDALQALQVEEAAMVAARRAVPPEASAPQAASRPSASGTDRLKTARQHAARTCLGGSGDPPPPTARAMPPAEMPRATPPPVVPLPPLPARVQTPGPVVLLPRADRPVLVTSCDAGGCWSSDGIWRPRVGPTLGGPAGLCTRQGVLISCP